MELRSSKTLAEGGVLGLGLFQNGNVGIRVFPQGEKVLVGGAGFRLVARERVGTSDGEVGKRANDFVGDHAGPVENFPKFNSRGGTLPSGQAGSASQISG